jgi:hypothetical protein
MRTKFDIKIKSYVERWNKKNLIKKNIQNKIDNN